MSDNDDFTLKPLVSPATGLPEGPAHPVEVLAEGAATIDKQDGEPPLPTEDTWEFLSGLYPAEVHRKPWGHGSERIAAVWAYHQNEAADLIAAAPELYRSLEELSRIIGYMNRPPAPPVLERAYAALKKARGER